MRIAYLQACKAIDSENKIKQQSPHHTHTQTLPFTHTCTHSSTHSLSCSPSPFLSLCLSLSRTPAQWRQLSWIIAAGSFLQFAQRGGGGHFNRRRRRRRHNKLQRSSTHGRAAQRCLCLLLLWLRCPFAFRIPHPDAANEALSTASCGVRSWHSVRDEISWLMDVCSFPRFHSSTTVNQHQQPPVKQRLNRHLWHFEEDVRRYLRAENEV